MMWNVDFSTGVLKFLAKNHIDEEKVLEKIRLAVKFFHGEAVSIDIKKTKGKWAGFYRVRSGKLRIIAEFNFANHRVFIEIIDWRGAVYK